ncbi:cytochrome c oxidase assembly protein subunit 15 [Alteromonadaceae bacterium Bs31]|nr:cytochrome c oxidase assembly protein subunit 15 [Alteromonadaceae bacterium Bs31]
MMSNNKKIVAVAVLALIMASVVVVLGSFTRLAHAGLGCPDWPTCYGHLWVPNESHEIDAANAAFTDTPVETDKTWPEQIHRIFASSLGLVILTLLFLSARAATVRLGSIYILLGALVAGLVARIFAGDGLDPLLWLLVGLYFLNVWRLRGQLTATLRLAAILAGLVILQGFFGMWTVTLKLWPQVVTAHLLGGFATFCVIWLFIQVALAYQWRLQAPAVVQLFKTKKLAVLALGAAIVQITLGGWTSSNYAALACPDFPLCQNAVFPSADYLQGFNIFQHVGPNYLGGLLDNHARIAIHFSHRIGAIVLTVFCLALSLSLFKTKAPAVRRMALILLAALLAQISLGISNIVLSLPLSVAVLHNAGGAILLVVLVTINHRISSVKTL